MQRRFSKIMTIRNLHYYNLIMALKVGLAATGINKPEIKKYI